MSEIFIENFISLFTVCRVSCFQLTFSQITHQTGLSDFLC